MKPKSHAYIAHIRDALNMIATYTTDHTYEQFLKSPWDQAAVVRHLEIIGEAAAQLDDNYTSSHPQIPWRRISDFRNVLIHEYFAVDPLLVWEILQKDIPTLRQQIEKLLVQS